VLHNGIKAGSDAQRQGTDNDVDRVLCSMQVQGLILTDGLQLRLGFESYTTAGELVGSSGQAGKPLTFCLTLL
jgi:hypothetical protein